MFSSARAVESNAKLVALDRVQAIIEFGLDGTVLSANTNFLSAVGYTLSEIVGRHHSLFVDPIERESAEYRAFWDRLRAGEFQAAQYRRFGKGGREIWIEASYNPVLGRDGKPCKVVKFATDITRQKVEDAARAGRLAAIDKALAVIAFDLDGTVIDANTNFLTAMGYTLPEIVGRHHRQFVDPDFVESDEYAAFWEALRAGSYQAGQFKRLAKGGREVWIEASYNPILDASGRPYQVVKYATEITAQVTLLSDLRQMIDRNFSQIDAAVVRTDREAAAGARSVTEGVSSAEAMAAAAEQLSSSIAEIAGSMARSKAAADRAGKQVEAASLETKRLSDAAAAMTGIVGMIQTIAGQINLLALNATIEAARAGAAGRGFAVVASEVKALAAQAARATDQINAEISSVQSASRQVVGALTAITGSMGTMRDTVVGTAAAVEEQSAVTQDMSMSMQEMMKSVTAIAGNISMMTEAVADVSSAVAITKEAARVLVR